MLDKVQGVGNSGNTDKPSKSGLGGILGTQFRDAKSRVSINSSTNPSANYSIDMKRRLITVAGELEELLSNLSTLQSRAKVGDEILTNITKVTELPSESNITYDTLSQLNDDIKKSGLPISYIDGLDVQTLANVGKEIQSILDETSASIKDIEKAIAGSQVSFQNIITAGGTIDEGVVDNTVTGNFIHNGLNGENVILLLEK